MEMDLEKLPQKTAGLNSEKTAFEVQSKLLENFVEMARCSTETGLLKSALEKTLEIAVELTGAEKSSIFLLDSQGSVTDCILARGDVSSEQQSELLGSVLDKGLAGWVCRHCEVALITDTECDDRWLTLPDQPYTARSAMAVPIIRVAELSGILTLLHSKPGHFSVETAQLMERITVQIGLSLENAKLYAKLDESYRSLRKAKQEIEAYSNALDEELEKGKQIQKNFLPSEMPQLPGWEISACFHPARQVAGDFYDAFILPGNYLGLAIGDVCDKGVGSALFMALFRSLIRVFTKQCSWHKEPLPGISDDTIRAFSISQANALRAIEYTNNYIAHEHAEMCMFATVFWGVLDPEAGVLAYVNAGHEPPVIVSSNHIKHFLSPTGPAVGILPDITFKMNLYQFEPGDILFCFTDGVIDACSPKGESFTKKRLFNLIEQSVPSEPSMVDRVSSNLFAHIGNAPQTDDITILEVCRLS